MSRQLSRILLACLPIGFASTVAACGDDSTQSRLSGYPPENPTFDSGWGTSGGGGYASGVSGSSTATAAPRVCPEAQRRCAVVVTYPAGNESAAQVRGSWNAPDSWAQGIPMKREGQNWKATLELAPGSRVEYKFCLNPNGSNCETWAVGAGAQTNPGNPGNSNNLLEGVACTEFTCAPDVTPWTPGGPTLPPPLPPTPPGVFDWRDAVMYFVFVDRFADGNPSLNAGCRVAGVSGDLADYQGGDWAGVTQKINEGYFTSLGVNALWLTVPFENAAVRGQGVAPDSNWYSAYHGYWPKVDNDNPNALETEKCFGTLDELKALVDAAHAKGIKVLFDYAMVHVHSSSALFARHGDWFWTDSSGRGPKSICGGDLWNRLPDREQCWFTDYLPHWNYTNQAARDWSVTQAIAWAKQTGVDGYRLDAIKHVDIQWLKDLRARLTKEVVSQQNPPQRFYMVGETYEFGDRGVIKSYIDPATMMDGQFDFPLRARLVESVIMRTRAVSDMVRFMEGEGANDGFYSPDTIMSTWIGNHDLPRVIHLAGNQRIFGDDQGNRGLDRNWYNTPSIPMEREAFERVANGFAVLLTNPGVPLIYYGDEIGLPGAGDPDNRRFMQWSGLGPNQEALRERISKLTAIRSAHPALRRGRRQTLSASGDTWVFVQRAAVDNGQDEVYVALNVGDVERSTNQLPAEGLKELVTGVEVTGPKFTLPPRQVRIFVRR